LGELLEDAAKADETILHMEDNELARLWERIGNADIAETPPTIGEEFFYLVRLRRWGQGSSKTEDLVVYRCVVLVERGFEPLNVFGGVPMLQTLAAAVAALIVIGVIDS
jgi:hypothetical protein